MDLSAIWREVGKLLDALGASWAAILKTPPPIIGGIVGGLLTGGLFGWISHVRSIRPILIFFRDENESAPKWKLKNIGRGPAMHIRIRDYDAKGDVVRKVRPYPSCLVKTGRSIGLREAPNWRLTTRMRMAATGIEASASKTKPYSRVAEVGG